MKTKKIFRNVLLNLFQFGSFALTIVGFYLNSTFMFGIGICLVGISLLFTAGEFITEKIDELKGDTNEDK